MPRILVIVPFPLDERNLAQRRSQGEAVRLPDDVELVYRTARVAPSNYVSGHDSVIAELSMMEVGMRAEAEGFDAVCIDTMSDTGVTALRSVLRIPVIGPGRHTMLAALMLGRRFSILTMWDAWKPLYSQTIADLGLQAQCASVRAAGIVPDNRNLLAGKEEQVFPRLVEAGRRCVEEDGADVLILGSTTMHDAHAHLCANLPVPVIDPGPASYALAVAAIRLRSVHSLVTYPLQPAPSATRLRAVVEAGAAADATRG